MDPGVVPQEVFDAACDGKLDEVVELLASAAAPREVVNAVSPDVGNATLLSYVTFGMPFGASHAELVRLLISHGANVNQIEPYGSSPLINVLHFLSYECSGEAVIDMVKSLLSAGANVNWGGSNYGFPISVVAVSLKSSNCPDSALIEEVVTMLLRAGASVDRSSANNVSGWQLCGMCGVLLVRVATTPGAPSSLSIPTSSRSKPI